MAVQQRAAQGRANGAPKLQEMWKINVLVDNKPGAAGVLAADHVAKQAPDGSTPLMAHINSHAIVPAMQPTLSQNAETDFVPLCLVGVTPSLLIRNTSQPARTLADTIAAAKARPGPGPLARPWPSIWRWSLSSSAPRSSRCTSRAGARAR